MNLKIMNELRFHNRYIHIFITHAFPTKNPQILKIFFKYLIDYEKTRVYPQFPAFSKPVYGRKMTPKKLSNGCFVQRLRTDLCQNKPVPCAVIIQFVKSNSTEIIISQQ